MHQIYVRQIEYIVFFLFLITKKFCIEFSLHLSY